MRIGAAAWTALSVLVLVAGAAPAGAAGPALSNVQDFDAAQLDGASCRGTLQDRNRATFHGGVRVTFQAQGGALVGHLWGRLGEDAFQNAKMADNDLDDQGDLSELSIKGSAVTFKSVRGTIYQLTYGGGGTLNGVSVSSTHTPNDIAMDCAK